MSNLPPLVVFLPCSANIWLFFLTARLTGIGFLPTLTALTTLNLVLEEAAAVDCDKIAIEVSGITEEDD